jgi:hypothetical protein
MKKKCIMLVLVLVALLASCKPIKQIEYRDVYKNKLIHDSTFVYKFDSVYIHQKGDTVWVEKFKTLFRDKYHNKTDTVFDTKFKDRVIEKRIPYEKKQPWYNNIFILIGRICSISGLLFLLYFFIRLKLK